MPTVIKSHQLVDIDPADELEFIEELLDEVLETVALVDDNLGADFHRSLRLLGYRSYLRRGPEDILAALRTIVEFGVALFERGQVGPDTIVTLRICGHRVRLPGGVTIYHSAPCWLDAVGAALCLRDQPALASLAEYKVCNFRGDYDVYLNHLAQALIHHIRGQSGVGESVAQAQSAVENAHVFPERAQRLGRPTLAVVESVLLADGAQFNEHLIEGLGWYRTLHERPKHNHEAQSVIPLLYLGLSALAHDRGIPSSVESDYVPAWLVQGAR